MRDPYSIIDNVCWYNGLYKYVFRWLEPVEYAKNNNVFMECPDRYAMTPDEFEDCQATYWQLQVIWMQLVIMFGDYGTSPRFGWITDTKGFEEFVTKIVNDNLDEI